MVMGGLNCLSIPWGTALGVATFLTLGRVTALFDAPPAPKEPPRPEGPPPSP